MAFRLSIRVGVAPIGFSGRTSSIVRRLNVDSPVLLERNGCAVWFTADADAMTTARGGVTDSVSLGFMGPVPLAPSIEFKASINDGYQYVRSKSAVKLTCSFGVNG